MSDGELGRLLRNLRESVRPGDVGLPEGGRRRTPGLRRAELAILAGVSVDYLVRLEQGRDTRPSAQVLAALADALRLDADDRLRLGHLASLAHKGALYRPPGSPASSVRPSVQAVLDHLEPAPAYVVNRVADILAWTPAFHRLAEPLGLFDCPQRTNLVRFTFGDPRARRAFPDWELMADDQVDTIRSAGCPTDVDPALRELVDELTLAAGEAFTERWARHPRLHARPGRARIAHPEVGELRLDQEVLHLPDAEGQHLTVLLAADDRTATALDTLRGRRPGALRAVPAP